MRYPSGGQHRTDGEHSGRRVAGSQDVGVLTKRLGPRVVGVLAICRPNSSSPTGGTPGEIQADWVKPSFASLYSRAGRVNASDGNSVGIPRLDRTDQPRPEVRRLVVRIVHPEDADAVGDPVPHHPQHLPRQQALRDRCRSSADTSWYFFGGFSA